MNQYDEEITDDLLADIYQGDIPMRGTFDFDTEQYPFLAQRVGVEEVCVRNQLTGEEFYRQPVAGEPGSEERQAQSADLRDKAITLCRESRKARAEDVEKTVAELRAKQDQ